MEQANEANQPNAANQAGQNPNDVFVPVNNQARVVEQFRRYSPPTFTGKEEPAYVEDWFRSLERTFKLIGCSDTQRVICAEYQLAEGADHWWEGYWRTRPEEEREATTWNGFKELLRERYYPRYYREQMQREFWELKQEGLSVTEYERKFTDMSRFATHLVSTDLDKARRFLDGLRPGIRHILKSHGDLTYAETVKRAQEIAASHEMDRKQAESLKKRKMESQGQNGNGNQSKQRKTNGNAEGNTQSAKPLCLTCGKNHYGVCLAGQGKCYRCKQPRHETGECPVFTNKEPEKRGPGGKARVYVMK